MFYGDGVMKTKFLCICQKGNSRSVALAYLLKKMGHYAIAVGYSTTPRDLLKQLCKWADQIILVAPRMMKYIPERYRGKVLVFDVGTDVYFKGYDKGLLDKYKQYIKEAQVQI